VARQAMGNRTWPAFRTVWDNTQNDCNRHLQAHMHTICISQRLLKCLQGIPWRLLQWHFDKLDARQTPTAIAAINI